MLHSFASSRNEDEFISLYLFLCNVGCTIFTKYFEVSYGGDPIVDILSLSLDSSCPVHVLLKVVSAIFLLVCFRSKREHLSN